MIWVCCASGPSLNKSDIDYCKSKGYKIAVANNAYQLCPDADILLASDTAWWKEYAFHVSNNFTGKEKWTLSSSAARNYKLNLVETNPKRFQGLSDAPLISNNMITGARLINLVMHREPSAILLLGYDMNKTDDKVHFFGDHPPHMNNFPHMENFIPIFDAIAKDSKIPIYNCNKNSAITAFDKVNLYDRF